MKIRIPKITLAVISILIILLIITVFVASFLMKKEKVLAPITNEASAQNTKSKTVDKSCNPLPPTVSTVRVRNAKGAFSENAPLNITEGLTAFNAMVTEARKWSSDVKFTDLYGQPQSLAIGSEGRIHLGEEGGAMYSWSATAYSSSKKQFNTYSYVDGAVSEFSPSSVDKTNIGIYENAKDIIPLLTKVIPSCKVYEILKKQNLDEANNYYVIKLGEIGEVNRYPNRTVWSVQERSRTESVEEATGDLKYTYYIDAQTGEFLEKRLVK